MDRDEPTGRPQWRFTVFAQDDGGNGLVGYADVQVNLKDINDNAPLFPQGVYYGNVTENGTAGESIAAQPCMSFMIFQSCQHFSQYFCTYSGLWAAPVQFWEHSPPPDALSNEFPTEGTLVP